MNDINIILVDDNKPFLEALQLLLLKNLKCNILDICNNGQELIDSPYLIRANLIISDIEMPVVNGIQAAKIVNYECPNIFMIAITMHIEKVYLCQIISAGYRGFVYKPNVSKRLITVVKEVLNNKFIFPDFLKI